MSREVLRAIMKGDLAKIDLLVGHGADLNEVTEKERWSYLHHALLSLSLSPSYEAIQYLIDKGVDVNAIDAYGNTAIHYAVRLKRADFIKALIVAGADVNVVNCEGVSPLRQLFLVKPFDYECAKLLLRNGADKDQKLEGGVSVKAYVASVASRDTEIVELFNN
ncbi:MAG: ankyrin repeat domain-containing protein [Fluviicoccus sp.]|uniref:ankyrin repeat domain-containing protein n=1 Tax=Fluviicoccus sp. TaxID=2003552 RepID=UPI002723FBF9|nr:ankyrin repeat domain-containing protein [Fluviicoccus sp.]MDO8329881.1 ankyrin repeat domain-containing protein [Fluviicoccus sp.]